MTGQENQAGAGPGAFPSGGSAPSRAGIARPVDRPAAAGGSTRTRFPPPAAAVAGDSGNPYQVLAAAINAQIALIYRTDITLVQFPSQGNFPWFYESAGQVFNNGTFGYVSASAGPGDAAGLAKLSGPGSYPNAYVQLLAQIEYSVSPADVAANRRDAAWTAWDGNAVLNALRQAAGHPDETNGGMFTVDPDNGAVSATCQVGYSVNSPLATIANGLQSGQPTVTVHVPAGNGTTATISYPGCLLVAVAPATWQQATNTGWYDTAPLSQALTNGQRDVTGYRFTGSPSYNLGPLTAGGNFGRLVGLLISNPPAITFSSPSAAVNGVSPSAIASFYESLSLLNLDQPAGRDLFARPRSAGAGNGPAVPLLQQRAYVVGACLDFISQD